MATAMTEILAPTEPVDLLAKFDPIIQTREALLAAGVEDPFNLVMEQVLSPTRAICNGRDTILLGTYNYMGMTFDPDVIAAGKAAMEDFGAGTTGSRVLNGTFRDHRDVEAALREFYAMDHAMVFSTGYQANLGIISTLAGKGDYIILDIDSHASIYDGCAMGNAEIVPFRHNDVEALEKRLKRIPEGAGKLVVLEGVYSMMGDVAPLKEMVHHRHLFQERRHGWGLLRLEPPEVRSAATGVPSLRLYRRAAALGDGLERDLDPQADARREQARASVGEQPHTAQGPA